MRVNISFLTQIKRLSNRTYTFVFFDLKTNLTSSVLKISVEGSVVNLCHINKLISVNWKTGKF